MAKEPLTTRLDADTKAQVETYAEEHEIGQTEAARRLIRAGLAKEGHPVTAADGGTVPILERLAAPRMMLYAVGLMAVTLISWSLSGLYVEAGEISLALATFALGGGSLVIGTVIVAVGALAQLALARPLRGLVGFGTEAKA